MYKLTTCQGCLIFWSKGERMSLYMLAVYNSCLEDTTIIPKDLICKDMDYTYLVGRSESNVNNDAPFILNDVFILDGKALHKLDVRDIIIPIEKLALYSLLDFGGVDKEFISILEWIEMNTPNERRIKIKKRA
jgi:hypothetical protein